MEYFLGYLVGAIMFVFWSGFEDEYEERNLEFFFGSILWPITLFLLFFTLVWDFGTWVREKIKK